MEELIKQELLKLSNRVFIVYIPEEGFLTDIKLPNLNIVSQQTVRLDSKKSIITFIKEYQIIQDLKNKKI